MGFLTTHVLDTAHGTPAGNMRVDLYRLEAGEAKLVKTQLTDNDGRPPEAMLTQEEFLPGVWELVFHVSDYYTRSDMFMTSPPFLQKVPIRFGIADQEAHYHVPLLVSPWSYSTYRGS